MTAALLVMESRGIAPGVRSFNFAQGWSRLYKLDEHFLDMSCERQGESAVLLGQVVGGETTPAGSLTLRGVAGEVVAKADLDAAGAFRLEVDPVASKPSGQRLEIGLSQAVYAVADFDID